MIATSGAIGHFSMKVTWRICNALCAHTYTYILYFNGLFWSVLALGEKVQGDFCRFSWASALFRSNGQETNVSAQP